MLFGGNLKSLWQGFGGGLAAPQVKTTQLGVTTLPSQKGLSSTTVSFKTAKGNTITLEGYQTSPLGQSIATLGANGTTTVLANNLAQLAQELLESGDISESQYNILIQLSDAGHKQAMIEAVIEHAANSAAGASSSTFLDNTQVVLDGHTKTIGELWNSLGYNAPGGGGRYFTSTGKVVNTLPADLLHPASSDVASSLEAFLDVYHQAESSGALSDPVVEQVVSSLSTQIALTSDALVQAVGQVYLGNSPAGQIQTLAASATTHMDSAGICTAGSGTDSGVSCSP
jgi:hypothetical protein